MDRYCMLLISGPSLKVGENFVLGHKSKLCRKWAFVSNRPRFDRDVLSAIQNETSRVTLTVVNSIRSEPEAKTSIVQRLLC